MSPDELNGLSRPDLIARIMDLEQRLANADDDLRQERLVSQNLDQAAMSFREAYMARTRSLPLSSRDIPDS